MKRPRRSTNYTHAEKYLAAIMYLIHGNALKAAEACGFPERTVSSWIETEEWQELIAEARAAQRAFVSKREQDTIWEKIVAHVDQVAVLGSAVSVKIVGEIAQKIQNKQVLTDKEQGIVARLFEIAVEKAMMVRGIGREGGLGSAFDDFKDRLADAMARLEDETKMRRRRKDGHGDINRLVDYEPQPPKASN